MQKSYFQKVCKLKKKKKLKMRSYAYFHIRSTYLWKNLENLSTRIKFFEYLGFYKNRIASKGFKS